MAGDSTSPQSFSIICKAATLGNTGDTGRQATVGMAGGTLRRLAAAERIRPVSSYRSRRGQRIRISCGFSGFTPRSGCEVRHHAAVGVARTSPTLPRRLPETFSAWDSTHRAQWACSLRPRSDPPRFPRDATVRRGAGHGLLPAKNRRPSCRTDRPKYRDTRVATQQDDSGAANFLQTTDYLRNFECSIPMSARNGVHFQPSKAFLQHSDSTAQLN